MSHQTAVGIVYQHIEPRVLVKRPIDQRPAPRFFSDAGGDNKYLPTSLSAIDQQSYLREVN